MIGITLLRVPESRDPDCKPLDLAGAALAAGSLAGITFGLTEASRGPFGSPAVLVPLLAGLLLGALFVVHESRSRHPMLPLALFRSRAFTATNAVTLFLYGSVGAMFFFLPFELIQARRYTPTQAGAALLPLIAVISTLARWTGKLGERGGPRLPLTAGPLLSAAGLLLFLILPPGSYWTSVFLPILVVGFGMALAVPPLTTTVMSSEKEKYAGIVSAFNNTVSRIGSLFAIAGLAIAVAATSGAFASPVSAAFRIAMGGSVALALAAAVIAAVFLPLPRESEQRR